MRSDIKTWRYWVSGAKFQDSDSMTIGHGHAVLGADGFFAAVTDYGSYVFSWRYGRPNDNSDWFRKAFLGFGKEYILDKMCQKDYWSPQRVFPYLRECLHSQFPQDRDSSGRFVANSKLQVELELLKTFENFPYEEEFQHWYENSGFYGDCEIPGMFYDYSPSAKAFAECFIPRLQEVVRRDLQEERGVSNYLELCGDLYDL